MSLRARWFLGAAFALSWALGAASVGADDLAVKQACIDAHAEAQQLVLDGKSAAAGERLAVCLRAECPAPVRTECTRLLGELNAARPRLVIDVFANGAPAPEAGVLVDGAKVAAGELAVSPGEHVVRIEAPGFAPLERRVVVQSKERALLRFDLSRETAKPLPPTPRPAPIAERPIPTATWILGGAALVALGTAAAFGHAGRVEQVTLEAGCAPTCGPGASDAMRRDYLIADVALGVSALAFAGATWTFLARPSVKPAVQVGAHTMGLTLIGSF